MLATLSGGGGLATNWAINARGMQWRQHRRLKDKKTPRQPNELEKSLKNAATSEVIKGQAASRS